MASREKTIGITLGDPAGIGPEVVARVLLDKDTRRLARYVIFGDRKLLRKAASLIHADWKTLSQAVERYEETQLSEECLGVHGEATDEGGRASIDWVLKAIGSAMKGEIDAIVTAPISKTAIRLAGCDWPGHTEILEQETGAERGVMMMVGGGLRVSIVASHVAIAELPHRISRQLVASTIAVTADGVRSLFGIESPTIGVCGLNPHAGEAGRFGGEEQTCIVPAIQDACKNGIKTLGPVSADVIFHQALKGKYDAVVAMYHDQANIAVKTLAFETAVNVTLGLPFIRTSPGHGTAYDIAWQGCADPRSMLAAIKLAAGA